jgi:hypothetical protein
VSPQTLNYGGYKALLDGTSSLLGACSSWPYIIVSSISSFKPQDVALIGKGNERSLSDSCIKSIDAVRCRDIEFHVDLNIGGTLT